MNQASLVWIFLNFDQSEVMNAKETYNDLARLGGQKQVQYLPHFLEHSTEYPLFHSLIPRRSSFTGPYAGPSSSL